MPTPAEVAARTYVEASMEADRAVRVRLIEQCFATDGRLVTRSREIRGRDALVAMFDAFFADPRGLRARLTSAIDAGATSFRFHSAVDYADGTPSVEFHDAGMVDADGRITFLLTFDGPLAPA
jgi:hypothetical protein